MDLQNFWCLESYQDFQEKHSRIVCTVYTYIMKRNEKFDHQMLNLIYVQSL